MTLVTFTAAEEAARVESVESFGLVGQPAEPDLEAIARLAAKLAGVDLATINLVDATQHHQIATQGFTGTSGPREDSMCQVTVREDEPIYLPNAAEDPRFADSPWVTGVLGDVRFYNSSQLRTTDGHVIGALCVFDSKVRHLDADQRRALDDLADQVVQWLELNRRHHQLVSDFGQLQQTNADLTDFAGRISHDLRNPLTALIGFLTLADRRFAEEMSPRLQTIIATSLESANRMAAMVEDMFAFATAGREPDMSEVALSKIAADVLIDLSGGTAGVTLDIDELPTVTTDPTLVRALLQNLAANAMKFTRDGVPGHVRVTGGSGTDGSWWLSVADNGRGVPADEHDRIFEPFTRASNAIGAQGTGVGLATCVRIADRIGGKLTVQDTPGGGATFTLAIGG